MSKNLSKILSKNLTNICLKFFQKKSVKKSVQKFCQIFHPKKLARRYLQSTLPSNLDFTLKTVLLSNAILSFFLCMIYIFILQKIVAQQGCLYPFYNCLNFGQIFCTVIIHFFLWKIWDIGDSKRAANINW